MPASPADSAIYRRLLGDEAAAALFSDDAEIAAMLQVEAALARVQGAAGVIPAEAAAVIDREAGAARIDPAALADGVARDGVPVPALLTALRAAAGAQEAMQRLHWGATSQDIMDTALALRLRSLLDLWRGRLDALLADLAALALAHAQTPMAARTYGQAATPTSFGAVVAGWGWPLADWRDALAPLRPKVLRVSLSGAAGTAAALGPQAAALRAALAATLALHDPGRTWHADRSGVAQLAGFAAGLAGSLGKIGEDVLLMTQSGVAEIALGAGGASSTMPQKRNPVAPSALVALARQVIGLAAILQGASLHRQQRDGAAWFGEWLTLPQLCVSLSRCLSLTAEIAANIAPDPRAMARRLEDDCGLIHAEALSFALTERMPRPEAQALVAALCDVARREGRLLADQITERFPDTDWTRTLMQAGLGRAPAEARAFAAHVGAAQA